MQRLCLDCGTPLIGRADKKYCDDACRSHYNNKVYEQADSPIRQINSILRKNRKILQTLNPDGKAKIKLKKLQEAGFNFDYFTSLYQTTKGNQYRFCYDQGYLLLPPDEVLLVRHKNYKS